MDIDRLLALKEVRELFPADEKGNLPEGSCLLLSAMEELDFPPGRDIVTWGQAGEDGMYILMEGSAQVLDCHGEEITTLMGPGNGLNTGRAQRRHGAGNHPGPGGPPFQSPV